MDIKEQLHAYCQDFLNDRFTTVSFRIEQIQRSLESETKSSAGDKHETGRAMLQLEREKAGNQLLEVKNQLAIFAKVNVFTSTGVASLGSIVKTNKGNYFLAVSAGLIIVNSVNYYAVSLSSPIGKAILGKTVADVITFNGITQTINKII